MSDNPSDATSSQHFTRSTGTVDLQVNGYAGVDFNSDDVTVDQIRSACDALRNDQVAAILATVITDSVPNLEHRLRKIVAARKSDPIVAEMIVGIHIEGPFLNPEPGYIGAHPSEHAQPAQRGAMQQLLEAADGLVRIVTLAPECDPDLGVTRWLAGQGIVVSGGHCNPTLDQLDAAIDAGLSMFTHLGNGCPLQQHRHDNIIQRVLSRAEHLSIGFIADGIHVPFFALRNYLNAAGLKRAFIVTDAVSAAGKGPGRYTLSGHDVVVDENLATWAADRSHLVGSAMTMPRVEQNLVQMGFSESEVKRLTRTNPANAIGLNTT